MPMNAGTPIRLSSSNSVSHFANLTPKKHSKGGIIGLLRIIGLIAEIGATIVFPEATPAILLGGAIYQEGFDIANFTSNEITRKSAISFGANALVNFAPLIGVAKTLRATENVISMVDKEARTGVRYLVKGVDREFEPAFAKFANNSNRETAMFDNKKISRISINKERALISKKRILPKFQRKVIDNFEKELQIQFGATQTFDKVVAKAGVNKYYSKAGDFLYTNKDIAMLRHEVKAMAMGRRTEQQVVNNLKSLSSTAREAIGYEVIKGKRFIKSMGRRKAFANKLENLSNIYREEVLLPEIQAQRRNGFFNWFGRKKGQTITQLGQLANPNDLARELMNRPMGALLHGKLEFGAFEKTIFKKGGLLGWAKNVRTSVEKKAPKIAKILNMPLGKRLAAKYEEFKKALTEKGTLTKDDEFLMGWRTIKATTGNSEVMFYFNPINTSAKTRGSKNFGGKKLVQAIVRTSHLKYLAKTLTPGHCYLKGEGGFPPIAKSPGGKRAVIFEMMSEAMELASLYVPLPGIRNSISLVSNVKNVAKDFVQGIYLAKWKSTFQNTFTRLLPNKITRVFGKTFGTMINDEMGAHISRLLKTVGQGFQRTQTNTFYKLDDGRVIKGRRGMRTPVNSIKFKTRKTTFSFNNKFNANPLWKQGMPLTAKSYALRRAPRGTSLRRNIQGQRVGKNLRRPLGIVGLT